MRDVLINGRWRIRLPEWRVVRYLEFGSEGWEKARLASMFLNLTPTDVLLDIGMESGDLTALFARWVHEGGVMVVEPNPVAWPNARATFEENTIPDPIAHWVGFASDVTDTPVGADIKEPFGTGWPDCSIGPLISDHGFRHLAEETDTTPQITVDEFCQRAGVWPTAVTMDVEGAELQVLKGAHQLLVEHRPLVWLSIHEQFLRHHFRQRTEDVLSFLEGYGYRLLHLADDHESHWMASPK